MSTAEEEKIIIERKGFAGLSSMISNVDAALESIPKHKQVTLPWRLRYQLSDDCVAICSLLLTLIFSIWAFWMWRR